MTAKLANCVAIGVPEILSAAQYYKGALGFEVRKEGRDFIELESGDLTLILAPDDIKEPTFVLEVDDVELTVTFLEGKGFERVKEMDGETIVKDRYGYLFCVSGR